MVDLPEVSRTISGKGEIKIPNEYGKAKNAYLYINVIRRVKTPSLNFTWNPDKGFYAHVSFCIDDYVLQTYDVNFVEQVFHVYDGMQSQILVSLKCAVREILGRTPLISTHKHNTFDANRIKFECFASTALKLTLKGEKLDLCDEEDAAPNAPPNPPPKIPEVPPDAGLEVDPPYEDDPDGNNTNPFPGDEEKNNDFPIGDVCEQLNVTIRYRLSPNEEFRNSTEGVYGPINSIDYVEDPRQPGIYTFVINCRGGLRITPECLASEEDVPGFFIVSGEPVIEWELISVDPV